MDLLPIFRTIEESGVGAFIRRSQFLFPVIESVHLLGLAAIGGAVLIVDLRLLGLGFKRQPVAQIAGDASSWLIGSLAVMLITGILLFVSESVKCYYSQAFWFKMASLTLAILFTFTVRRRILNADEARLGRVWGKLTAVVSLMLWSGVGAGGRWIGFS
jgi:hypothetical protein